MLMIRLQRKGKKKQAFFRIVLQERAWKAQGKAIELLGFYNPRTKEKKFQEERIKYWLSKGAQSSPTVHNILVDAKIIEGKKIKAWQPKKKKNLPAQAGEAEKQETKKPTVTEVKPEEAKAEEAKPEDKEEVKPEKSEREVKEEKPTVPKTETKEKTPVAVGQKEPAKEKTTVSEQEKPVKG